MIIDTNLRFSNAQAITAAAQSTNVLDLHKGRDPGNGRPLFVVVVVTTAFTDAGSDSTLTVALEGDSTAAMVPAKSRDLFIIPALAAAGDTFISPLHPKGAVEAYQFLDLKYTPNNGNLTTGSVTSFIVEDVAAWVAYAKNYTIS